MRQITRQPSYVWPQQGNPLQQYVCPAPVQQQSIPIFVVVGKHPQMHSNCYVLPPTFVLNYGSSRVTTLRSSVVNQFLRNHFLADSILLFSLENHPIQVTLPVLLSVGKAINCQPAPFLRLLLRYDITSIHGEGSIQQQKGHIVGLKDNIFFAFFDGGQSNLNNVVLILFGVLFAPNEHPDFFA